MKTFHRVGLSNLKPTQEVTMDTETQSESGVSDVEAGSGSVTPLRPAFPPIKKEKLADGSEVRKIPVPSHR